MLYLLSNLMDIVYFYIKIHIFTHKDYWQQLYSNIYALSLKISIKSHEPSFFRIEYSKNMYRKAEGEQS